MAHRIRNSAKDKWKVVKDAFSDAGDKFKAGFQELKSLF